MSLAADKEAAIDKKGCASDVPCQIAGEEDDRTGHVFRCYQWDYGQATKPYETITYFLVSSSMFA